MNNGFIKTAAATICVRPADVNANVEMIIDGIREASDKGAQIIVFPELAITGVTCGDLFTSPALLQAASAGLEKIEEISSEINALIFVGLPLRIRGKVMNVAAAVNRGEVLGFCPQTYISLPEAGRYFETAGSILKPSREDTCKWHGQDLPLSNRIIFRCNGMEELAIACEIGSDARAAVSPGTLASMAGAAVIVNCGSDRELPGSGDIRRELFGSASRKNICGYVYAGAGIGESTSDQVYSGHSLIAECGDILSESVLYENGIIYSDIDVERVAYFRSIGKAFERTDDEEYWEIGFNLEVSETRLDRKFALNPFIPEDPMKLGAYCEEILNVQARGLSERMRRINCKHPVVGISGGLDSTLALIASARAMDILGLPRENIEAITMPCFGTTQRTKTNADRMIEAMGAHYRMINIGDSVICHFNDIGHDEEVMNAAYENAQARERTQVLMDIANDIGGIVVGTGDLSELALGWATYNGDHMSMYGVNATIPKTLVRILVAHYADTCGDKLLKKTLYDVIDTPVSPELIPGRDGQIDQKTEDLVGPYEIHDFVLYHTLKNGYEPAKIYRIACETMQDCYDPETIGKWMNNFYRRFFSQQFKRSCSPEGAQAGPVSLSPRGGLNMPSDASSSVWLESIR